MNSMRLVNFRKEPPRNTGNHRERLSSSVKQNRLVPKCDDIMGMLAGAYVSGLLDQLNLPIGHVDFISGNDDDPKDMINGKSDSNDEVDDL